jgi:hypothetical protein
VLVDHRYYRVKPGTMNMHLDMYGKHGFGPQTRHLGQPLAYLTTESGEVNTIVHMWVYEDVADRVPSAPPWRRIPIGSRSSRCRPRPAT